MERGERGGEGDEERMEGWKERKGSEGEKRSG